MRQSNYIARMPKGMASFALIIVVLCSSGCASLLQSKKPSASVAIPEQFGEVLAGDSIADIQWSAFFNHSQLKQLIELGLTHNSDLKAAALNVERVQSQYKIRQYGSLPSIEVTGDATRTGGDARPTVNQYTVDLRITSYELDLWGRVANLRAVALENFLATQQARSTVQMSLIAAIAQGYITLAADHQQLELAKETQQAQQAEFDLNQKRFDIGVIAEVPLRQAQVSLEQANLALLNYQTLVAQDKNMLQLLVGVPLMADQLPINMPTSITDMALGAGVPSELLQRRPDIMQAEYQLRAAGANIGVARAAYFPSISLTGLVGFASADLSRLFSSNSYQWEVGSAIDLPIFDIGVRRANVRTAEIDQQLALTNYEKAIQVAFKEVSDVLAVRADISERLASQQRLVDAASVSYGLSQARFKAGVASYLEVLDAQRTLFSVKQALIDLQQLDIFSQINLYKVLGGGWQTKSNTP